jgi:Predicted signal-transduction protein containing cAMP-binding and CBS domains
MSIVDVELFLKQIYPFELLTNQELSEIVNNLAIEYYKKGQKIEDVDNYLYVVLKGVVVEKDSLGNEVGYFGQGSFFDVSRVINGSENIFEAFEESILYKIDKKIILKLVNENERFGEYFKKSTKEKLSSIASENPYFFLKVKEIELQQPVIVSKDTPFTTRSKK